MSRAYYNEIDPYAAQWLRNLIAAGHIAEGDVDERSIVEVTAADLAGYTQCHFFAGIGVWSHALRSAGWSDDREVWTGSCPCQPFSSAGKRGGFDDERHLWPEFFRLIEKCRPSVVFGEQVASKDGLAWIDTVQTDLEGAGYASAAFDMCAAGFGAPHIRQRLYFVADTERHTVRRELGEGVGTEGTSEREARQREWRGYDARAGGTDVELADTPDSGLEGTPGSSIQEWDTGLSGRRYPDQLADTSSDGHDERHPSAGGTQRRGEQGRLCESAGEGSSDIVADTDGSRQSGSSGCRTAQEQRTPERGGLDPDGRTHATNGFWRVADWLYCRDGKWRSVEPGTFPLVDVTPARVGRLRAYGNAIVAAQAQGFIEAYMDIDRGVEK